eukprot:SAG11_NODE_9402_length_915_cov_4.596814_1_plen_116_part_00
MNVTVAGFSEDKPIEIEKTDYSNFKLYHIAPIAPKSSIAYLGELGKWVPVADARTTSITDSAAGLSIGLVGVAAEKVQLAFFDDKAGKSASVLCTIGAAGTATATMASGGKPTCK